VKHDVRLQFPYQPQGLAALPRQAVQETKRAVNLHLQAAIARVAPFVRKQVTQLPSKMRFVAAQLNALLRDGLWLANAEHSNAMARVLYDLTAAIPGVVYDAEPQVNAIFPHLPADAIKPLQDWCFFWDWSLAANQVRWMTAWDTTADDVAAFAAGVREQVVNAKH